MFYKSYNLLFPTSWLSMIIRACLCALDWNYNVKRPHKLDEFGKAMYREKVVIEPYKRANFLTLFYTGGQDRELEDSCASSGGQGHKLAG